MAVAKGASRRDALLLALTRSQVFGWIRVACFD